MAAFKNLNDFRDPSLQISDINIIDRSSFMLRVMIVWFHCVLLRCQSELVPPGCHYFASWRRQEGIALATLKPALAFLSAR